jgi:hypothetical protein
LKCAVVSLYSVVKQRLSCNTGKVCNSLFQFLLTIVLSIEETVFLFEYVLREGNRYTDLVEQFAEKFPETPVPHRNAVRRLTEKFRETGSVLDAKRSGRPFKLNNKKLMDISNTFYKCTVIFRTEICRKYFANKIKRVQACTDAREHHFQKLL